VDGGTTYTGSAHHQLGFTPAAPVEGGWSTSPDVAAKAFEGLFAPDVTATVVPSDDPGHAAVELSSTATGPGARLTLSAPAPLVMPSGTIRPQATSLTLYGAPPGAEPEDLDPVDLVGPGDVVETPDGTAVVTGIDRYQVLFTPPLPAFQGDVVVRSALTVMWGALEQDLLAFLTAWLKTRYAKNLDAIDAVLAPLYGDWTQAKRNEAVHLLGDLRSSLQRLSDLLSLNDLPAGAAAGEQVMVSGIISTLQERKFDRALDLLLRCRVREVFDLDWQTVSYGGELMAAAAGFVQKNVRYPDRTKDEGSKSSFTKEIP
jgi:hypothetical protein